VTGQLHALVAVFRGTGTGGKLGYQSQSALGDKAETSESGGN